MSKIACFAFLGGKKSIDSLDIHFRPSVYGVIRKENSLLVAKTKRTGKYALPGGGADYENNLESALKREVKEETGIDIKIERFLHFNENYFYYDPMNEAFDSYQYFYLCSPITFALAKGDEVDDYEAGDPEWVQIDSLNEDNFQGVEMGILSVLRKVKNEEYNN